MEYRTCIAVRSVLALFGLIAALVLSVAGQRVNRDDLVLTASLVKPPAYDAWHNPGFVFDLYFQFRNDSNISLIVIRPDKDFFGNRKVTFSGNVACFNDERGRTINLPWKDANQFVTGEKQIEWHAGYFQEKEPRDLWFRIIPPGGYFEGYDHFKIPDTIPPDVNKKSGEKVEKVVAGTSRCQFPAFTIEYYLSARDLGEDTDFLGKAQQRWKPLGLLFLDSDDAYSVVSSEIFASIAAKP